MKLETFSKDNLLDINFIYPFCMRLTFSTIFSIKEYVQGLSLVDSVNMSISLIKYDLDSYTS